MKKITRHLILPLALFLGINAFADESINSAALPVARDGGDWTRAHAANIEAAKGGADLVFLGDSITAGWRNAGKKFWAERYLPRKAINLGIGGDRTENVLWRIQNGEWDGLAPKAVVLLIGTNNIKRHNTPPQIAEGIAAIMAEIQKRSPETKILLLALLPRGKKPDDKNRKVIGAINEEIAKLGDGKRVFFFDIGGRFVQPDGTISPSIMPDFLHPSPEGYQIFSDALEEKLPELLKS